MKRNLDCKKNISISSSEGSQDSGILSVKTSPKKNKINLFLDLDETLISSIPTEEFPFDQKGIKKKSLKFAIHNILDYYITFERPYLQEFLSFVFKNYNVSIWTAASKDYALYIIEKIIFCDGKYPERKLDYIFFSYHCEISEEKYGENHPKQLALLWEFFNLSGYNKNNTFIIDDLIDVYNSQPKRTIRAPNFNFLDSNSVNDDFLLKLATGDLDEKIKKLQPKYYKVL